MTSKELRKYADKHRLLAADSLENSLYKAHLKTAETFERWAIEKEEEERNSYNIIDKPPYTIIDPGYWREPVNVITGFTWFIVGLFIGILLMVPK